MSLDPRHQSGRPILDRKQTLADSHSRHNPLRILLCQLFPTANRDTGKGIYYNIHDPRPDNHDNSYRNASNPSHNVINFNDYRKTISLDRLSARDSGSHPSTLRSSGSRRLGSRDRMARVKLSARRSQPDRLQRIVSACIAFTLGPLLSDRLRSEQMGRSIGEHQSRSESLRRIRQTTLDSLNREPRV